MTGAPPDPDGSHDVAEMLDLEEIDRDLYRARSYGGPLRPFLFGGQVAAQALRAAILTVEPDRAPHSLHGYFLRRGTSARPLLLQVHRDRDGGSFSARRVLAVQNGEVIFSAAASFHVREDSPEFQVASPEDAPDPDDPDLGYEESGGPGQFFEMRSVVSPRRLRQMGFTRRLWTRARVALPDDDGLHACALTYATDFGSGFAELEIPGLAPAGPSLDHCIWFHHPIRLNDWVFIDLWPLRASGGRGTYMGTVHDRAGALGCVLTQEALLRMPPPGAPGPKG